MAGYRSMTAGLDVIHNWQLSTK